MSGGNGDTPLELLRETAAVIIASSGYLQAVRDLAIIVPATTTDRGWPHHVQLRGQP